MIGRVRGAAIGAAVLCTAGCSAATTSEPTLTEGTSPTTVTSSAPDPAEQVRRAALAAYDGYWQASMAASRLPDRAGGWRDGLAAFTADPALAQRLDSLANYASVPAHFEGELRRAPVVTSVSLDRPRRVGVRDCLDVSAWKLVSDRAGEQGKNLNNPAQPLRYVFTAEVVEYDSPARWLVQLVNADVRQPC